MARDFGLTPRSVPRVETALRRIVTELPPADSVPTLERLLKYEPIAMLGQPPVVWDHAEGFQVYDKYGNCWIDWSSGVLITNAGHGRREISDAVIAQASSNLLTNYCFPSEIRARLAERLAGLMPEPLKKIFLLTTGSEAVECAIKLCRTHGVKVGGRAKHIIVSFVDAFHGRTMGSQQAGGIPALKEWIVNLDSGFVQVPFPDGFRNRDTSFDGFMRTLAEQGIEAQNVAGVILETYQGGSAAFAPVDFMRSLRQWSSGHKVLLVCDEVQAGFGRTGTMFGFEHYGIVPDIATFGKGISSSLPLSAVAGSAEIMDLHGPGTMTSTHTGNPVCCAAALASLNIVVNENLAARASKTGALLHLRLREIQASNPYIGAVFGKGLVAGVCCVHPGTDKPDGDLAWEIVQRCWHSGVLLFSPVGFGGGTVKIAPPLVITEDAIIESTGVLAEAFRQAVVGRHALAGRG